MIIRTPAEYEQRYPGPDTLAAAAHGSSWLTWPLWVGTAPVGAIGLVWNHPQQFEPGQLALVAAVADLVAQAQVRARAYADEHALAAVLQRAVIPTTPAVIPGLEIGASYRQAGTAQQVGGDWYDAMALPGKRAYLAVGDTVGHGLTAAEDMTQLRNAGHTLAIVGHQPAGPGHRRRPGQPHPPGPGCRTRPADPGRPAGEHSRWASDPPCRARPVHPDRSDLPALGPGAPGSTVRTGRCLTVDV